MAIRNAFSTGYQLIIRQKGFGLAQYAECLHKVMIALGHQEYGMEKPLIIARPKVERIRLTCIQLFKEATGAV